MFELSYIFKNHLAKVSLTSNKINKSKSIAYAGSSQVTNCQISVNNIHNDQEENKSIVLSFLLFYRNICLSFIVHICIPAIGTQSFNWFSTSQKNLLLIN
jgi:hypothetical protein